MRRNFMKSIVMGATTMAGLTGAGQVASAKLADTKATAVKYEATNEKKKAGKQKITVNPLTGGLDMPAHTPGVFGLTPKEYGQRFGNGGSKRSNRLRYSHNAKLKRRMAA